MIHHNLQIDKRFFGFFKNAINKLRGSNKRLVAGELSLLLGTGGQSFVSELTGISRITIRKGAKELQTGNYIEDDFNKRGRKKTEEKLLNILDDIKDVIDHESQTDPSFRTTKLYTKVTIKEVRNRLINLKNYTDEELPTNQTLNKLVNDLGYTLKKFKKSKPLKKLPETDDIFKNLKKVHEEIAKDDNVIRISIDAKNAVKIGEFSRGGRTRVETKVLDHDYGGEKITPFGIYDVKNKDFEISLAKSKITADYIADRIEEYYEENNNGENVLVINADNGQEGNSSRTQYIKRMVNFSLNRNLTIILAYYPPYHSKYNPVERLWGRVEQTWNSEVLIDEDTVINILKNMEYQDKKGNIKLIEKTYNTGISIEESEMNIYKSMLERGSGIEKWYVKINPDRCKEVLEMEILN